MTTINGTRNMNLSLKSYWNLLSDHIRPQRGRFFLLAFMLFSSIGLKIFAPQIMRRFIDSALAGEALSTLTWTAIAFISVALIQQGVHISVTWLGENVAWTATNDLRAELAAGEWRPGKYVSFYIHEPKKRLISAAPFRDRVVHHALCNILESDWERRFIHDTYANRLSASWVRP
jgi:retron-type reverse transcriptase